MQDINPADDGEHSPYANSGLVDTALTRHHQLGTRLFIAVFGIAVLSLVGNLSERILKARYTQ